MNLTNVTVGLLRELKKRKQEVSWDQFIDGDEETYNFDSDTHVFIIEEKDLEG